VPADLRVLGSKDPSTESVGHHLGPKTDAKNRDSALMRLLDKGRLAGHVVRDAIPIDAPFRAQEQNKVMTLNFWPFFGVLAVGFREGKSVMPEPFPDKTTVSIGRIGNHNRTHPHHDMTRGVSMVKQA